jgi:hypothetical protein
VADRRPTPHDLRRRWERRLLRLEGRLDGGAADRTIPWSLTALAFVAYAALAAAAIRTFDGGSGLAPWVQAAWRRDHGGAGRAMAGQDPAAATWSGVGELALQIARLVPPEAVFVTIQAAALAAAVVPLWRLAREDARLRVGTSTVVLVALVLAPTIHRAMLTPFHPEVVALPALLWAYHQVKRGHHVRFGVLVVVVLASRADLGLTVAALGLLVLLTEHRRVGGATIAAGLTWTAVAVVAVRPIVPERALTPSSEFVARSATPLAVAERLVLDPFEQIRLLLQEPAVLFLVVALAPLLFLPLVALDRLAVAGPALSLAMIADTIVQEAAQRGVADLSPAAAHVTPAMAFVFIALVAALERIGTPSVTRVNVDRRLVLALLAGATLFFVVEGPASPYRAPWSWGGRDAIDGARLEAAALIPPAVPVATSAETAVLVAERGIVVELPPDPDDLTPARVRSVARSSRWVLLDTTTTDRTTQQPRWTDREREVVIERFSAAGLSVRYRAQGIVLLAASDQPAVDASG